MEKIRGQERGQREQCGGCCHLKNSVDLVATNGEKGTRGLHTSVHLVWILARTFPKSPGRTGTKGKGEHAQGMSQQMTHTQGREFQEVPKPLIKNVVYKERQVYPCLKEAQPHSIL